MTIRPEDPIGRIAADYPATTRVFERHRLDYCCGGERPLAEACASRDIDVEVVIREIEEDLKRRSESNSTDWTNWSAAGLISHIVDAYHEPLRSELPRLTSMARKVAAVHGARHPSLVTLSETVRALSEDLRRHMTEEEEVVFPGILGDRRDSDDGSIAGLEHDHDEAGAALEKIRELTGDYAVPPDACSTWRALWSGLEELERTMHEHVHLENDVLFPRAAAR